MIFNFLNFFVPKNFERDFFDNHGGRRSIAGIKESFKGNAARARLARGFITKKFPGKSLVKNLKITFNFT